MHYNILQQDCLDVLLEDHFPIDALTKKELRHIKTMILGFMFRAYSAKALTTAIRTAFDSKKLRVIDFRQAILSNGYLMKNLKLWIAYQVYHGKRKDFTAQFHIDDCDRHLKNFIDEHTEAYLNKLFDKGYPVVSIEKFDRVVSLCLQAVNIHIKKYVFRKMKFIIQSHKVKADDLITDLVEESFKVILHYYPNMQNVTHIENIMKRHMHNRGVNLMQSYSTKKRSNLMRDSSGEFKSKLVSIDTIYGQKEVATMTAEQEDTDLRLTVLRLLSKYNGKRRKFLTLIMGVYDAKFSEYLKTVGINSANDSYFDSSKNMDTYITHALDYLKVDHSVGFKFVAKIRKQLAA